MSQTFPFVNIDGVLVYACCYSSIGQPCAHRILPEPSPISMETVQFFGKTAGLSIDPETETEAEARTRVGKALAQAEHRAEVDGFEFHWYPDEDTSASFSDENPAHTLWVCAMYDENGGNLGGIGGVDLGPDTTPGTDVAYCRVIQAEIAREHFEDAIETSSIVPASTDARLYH